jgi:hypothetical protein
MTLLEAVRTAPDPLGTVLDFLGNRTPVFAAGDVHCTPSVLEWAISHPTIQLTAYLAMHLAGEWGDLDLHDRQTNDHSVRTGGRILSSYRQDNDKDLWIITEADRSHTTLLWAEEY